MQTELSRIENLLRGASYDPTGLHEVSALSGDGSNRRFYRCHFMATGLDSTALLVLPEGTGPADLAEAAATEAIGRHLAKAGVAVPAILGFDPANGALVMEDLGDTLLHHRLRENPAAEEVKDLYQQALKLLLALQISARPGFSQDFCWDTPRYDLQFMLEREANYFHRALVEAYLGLDGKSSALAAEFTTLAKLAASQEADFILHLDYQCRNLMLRQGQLRVIDFQGARLGPLGYDLAALLYDPYAGLSPALREELLDFYLNEAEKLIPGFDRQAFRRGWYYLTLQRNLQILGAFAFLTKNRGKIFFRQYLSPAAVQLSELLAAPAGQDFPTLRGLAGKVRKELTSLADK